MVEALVLIVLAIYLIVELGIGVGMIAGAGWSVLLLARYLSPTLPRAGLLAGGILGYAVALFLIIGLVLAPTDVAPALLVLPVVAMWILPVVPIAAVIGGAIGWGIRAVWRLRFEVPGGLPPVQS
ncbi:MAG TPA: hypothetical protein VLS25_12460 [Dehalococcoidia bacterium]|nr:hypothetical protein [Dehalococcoidia bacterium]